MGADSDITDVEHPGRLEIPERRLHPAYLVISFGRSVRSLLPVIAVGIWKAPGWAVGVLAALVLLRSVAEWAMRKYAVRDGSLRVRSGLFKRSQDTIGINRITALDAERGLVQRILGVWGLKVLTPGNDHRAAVRLTCLSARALEELRAAIDPRPTVPVAVRTAGPTDDHPAPLPLAVLDTRTLLLAAVTGTSIPLILAGAAATLGRARDLLPEHVFRHLTRDVFVGGATTAALLLTALVLAVLAGIALTSLRLARFTLVRDGSRLRISRGLIAQRSGTIPVDRVQAVRIVEGWWRRMIGYCALEVEVAGLSTTNDNERMLFPLIRTDRAAALVDLALPELRWHPAPLRRVPGRARRRYFTVPVLVGVVLTGVLALLPGWGALLAIPPLPVALLVGWGQSTDAAWLLDDTTVSLRWRRVLARHTVVARRDRVQLTEVSRTVWQRRVELAGVRMSLSSRRNARLRHLEAGDALLLLHAVGRRSVPIAPGFSEPASGSATYRGP